MLHLENESFEGQLWTFWDFPTKLHPLQQIKLEVVANKNFVLQNLNENKNFLLQTIFIFLFLRVISQFP